MNTLRRFFPYRPEVRLALELVAAWLVLFDSVPAGAQVSAYTVESGDGLALTLSANGALTSLTIDGSELLTPAAAWWPLRLHDAVTGAVGWLGGTVTNANGAVVQTGTNQNLRVTATYRGGEGGIRLALEVENQDPHATNRAIDLAFRINLAMNGAKWWLSLDESERLSGLPDSRVYTNCVCNDVSRGVGQGVLANYPVQVMTGPGEPGSWGLALAIDPNYPVVFDTRADHSSGASAYYTTCCVGLSPLPLWTPNRATVVLWLYRTDPVWGFRSALARFYQFFPDWFDASRSVLGGQCLVNPANIPDYVGIGYHEAGYDLLTAPGWGNNHSTGTYLDSVMDAMCGTKSLQYVNPYGCYFYFTNVDWYSRYECIPQIVRSYVNSPDPYQRGLARAVTNCMMLDAETGHIMHNWEDHGGGTYFLNIAVNAEPLRDLRQGPGADGSIYDIEGLFWEEILKPGIDSNRRIGVDLAGVFADNVAIAVNDGDKDLSGTGVVGKLQLYDQHPDRIRYAHSTLTYRAAGNHEPALFLPAGYHTFLTALRSDFEAKYGRGLLIMGNTCTAWPQGMFDLKHLDTFLLESSMGNEEMSAWRITEAGMRDNRIFAHQKNLAGLDYGYTNHDLTLGYARQCLFWAVFPDVQGNWSRDRDIYEKYVPLVRRLGKAGWQPLTHGILSAQEPELGPFVHLERYGSYGTNGLYFAVRNIHTNLPARVAITIDANRLGIPPGASVWELVGTSNVLSGTQPGSLSFSATVPSKETLLFRLCQGQWTLLNLHAGVSNPGRPSVVTLTAQGRCDDESAAAPVVGFFIGTSQVATGGVARLPEGVFEAVAVVDASSCTGRTTFGACLMKEALPAGNLVTAELALPQVWHHLVHARLVSSNIPRSGVIVELPLDLESLLRQCGDCFPLDTASIRVCATNPLAVLTSQYLWPGSLSSGALPEEPAMLAVLLPEKGSSVGLTPIDLEIFFDSTRYPKPSVLAESGFKQADALFVRLLNGTDLLFDPTGANLDRYVRRGNPAAGHYLNGYYLCSEVVGRWNFGNGSEELWWDHWQDFEAFSATLAHTGPLVTRVIYSHGPKTNVAGSVQTAYYTGYGTITDVFKDGTIRLGIRIAYPSGATEETVRCEQRVDEGPRQAIYIDPRGNLRLTGTEVTIGPTCAEWWFAQQYQDAALGRYIATVIPDPNWLNATLRPDYTFDDLRFNSAVAGSNTTNTLVSIHLFGEADLTGLTDRVRGNLPMPLTVSLDGDGDGLPDGWEFAHGLNPLDPGDAIRDPDNDGQTNREEFWGDTDPQDADSCLRFTRVLPAAGGVVLEWRGGVSATQYLQACGSLADTNSSWINLLTNPAPSAKLCSYTNRIETSTARYYRLRAFR